MEKVRFIVRDVTSVVRGAISGWIQHSTQREAAAIAFYAIFSVIPLMMIGARVASFFIGRDMASSEVIRVVSDYVGDRAALIVENILNQRVLANKPRLEIWIALGVIVWSSTQVFAELRYALNRIWEIPTESFRIEIFRYLKGHLLALVIVIAIGLVLPVFLLLSTFVSTALAFIETSSPYHHTFWIFWNEVVTFVVATLIFFLFMRFLPAARMRSSDILPGALSAALIFTASKSLIGQYLSHSFVATLYSTTSSIVFIFIWVYLATMIFLFGAEISRAYALQFGSLASARNPHPGESPAP